MRNLDNGAISTSLRVDAPLRGGLRYSLNSLKHMKPLVSDDVEPHCYRRRRIQDRQISTMRIDARLGSRDRADCRLCRFDR